jgi:negative regulator of flagellin synthesis FlgM
MKINDSHIQSKLNVYQTAQTKKDNLDGADSKKPDVSRSRQDRVALTELGRSIADAQRAINNLPDIREPLVSRIRIDLQAGNYVVNNSKAAEGILRESMVNQAAMA